MISPKDMIKKKNGKISRNALPVKRTINLANAGEKPIRIKVAVPAVIIIVLLACLFSKVAVVDRLVRVSKARQAAKEMQLQVDAVRKKLDEYGNIDETYAHYTYSGMTEEELSLADREAVATLLDSYVFPRMTVRNWSLDGNALLLTVSGTPLEDVNRLVQDLEKDALVNFCSVTTAGTGNTPVPNATEDVTASVTIYLESALERPAEKIEEGGIE